MGIIEITWTPTIKSVEKKNTKWNLAYAILSINDVVDKLPDSEEKEKIIEALMRVL